MHWLRRLFFRKQLRAELAEEMRQHLDERTEALIAQGVPPEQAARTARRAMGNVFLSRERSEEVWQWRRIESLWADLRFALHQLRKSPGYTLTAVLTLAIGIGANAAIFTLIDDAMLRTLPVPQANELVNLGTTIPNSSQFRPQLTLAMIERMQGHTAALQQLSAWGLDMVSLPDDQHTLRSVVAAFYSGSMFDTLGVHPYLGRLLGPQDDVPGGPEGGWPVVLDYGFWKSRFHGDPKVVGTKMRISGQPAFVVGVLPKNFQGLLMLDPCDVYLPERFESALVPSPDTDPFQHPQTSFTFALGRLKPGETLQSLSAELATESSALKQSTLPATMLSSPQMRQMQIGARPGSRGVFGLEDKYNHSLLLLQALVLLVLLLCCTNLGGLQLARIQARQHEFAVRSALGAGRGRILQQCLVESLLLAVVGGGLAAALAWFSTGALSGYLAPPGSVAPPVLHPNESVLLCSAGLGLVTTLLFGLVPGIFAGRTPPALVLKAKATNRRGNGLRQRVIIPAQIALALVLVFGAGLFAQTLLKLRNQPMGFAPQHVMEVTAQFQTLKISQPQLMSLYQQMTDSLRAGPGIQAAAFTWFTPLTGGQGQLTAATPAKPQATQNLAYNEVGDDYFATIGTRLLAGRGFTQQDRDDSTCVLNEAAARLLFGEPSAVGETVKAQQAQVKIDTTCRVVGMVQDARYESLREPAPPTLYLPINAGSLERDGNLVFLIRSRTNAEAISAYRAALARYAPDTGYMIFLPMREQVDESLGSERLIALLSSAFAGIALALSAIGLFGMLSLQVQQRMPEMGVRMALGATRGHVVGLVLRQALRMVAAGIFAGAILAAIAGVMVRSFLYGTTVLSPAVILVTLGALSLAALIAVLLPARRVAYLEPSQVLRQE
jgi:predicted permease